MRLFVLWRFIPWNNPRAFPKYVKFRYQTMYGSNYKPKKLELLRDFWRYLGWVKKMDKVMEN